MRLEALKSKQREIFKKLPAFSDFYLVGGTAGKRATLKDYADLYFILKQKIITLEQIIRGCQKKYKQDFNDRLFLEELTYLEDVSEAKIEFLKEAPSRGQMIEFFEEEIKKVKI